MTGTKTANGSETDLDIVNGHLDFPQVSLDRPTDRRYVHLAATVDEPLVSAVPVYLVDSDEKRALVAECKRRCETLESVNGVVETTVFTAVVRPPGRGKYLNRTEQTVHVADFDVTVLIEIEDDDARRRLERNQTYLELEAAMEETARAFHRVVGTNERRIGPVDHDSDGVFLFNYFFAEDVERNLDVWEYTAGWFQSETGLDNSTLIVPDDPDRSEYAVINHCRWDGLRDVLPALVLKRTFRTYVLANFETNEVAPMPILYERA